MDEICPENFDNMVSKFKQLPMDTEEKFRLCVELVFEQVLVCLNNLGNVENVSPYSTFSLYEIDHEVPLGNFTYKLGLKGVIYYQGPIL